MVLQCLAQSELILKSFFLGTLLLMSSQNEDSDMLWVINSDSFPFQKQLMETHVRWSNLGSLCFFTLSSKKNA